MITRQNGFASSKTRDFDSKNARTTYICDGHFDDASFNSSQKVQFLAGFRKKAPELLLSAIPKFRVAVPPHFAIKRDELTVAQMEQDVQNGDLTPIAAPAAPPRERRRRSNFLVQKEIAAMLNANETAHAEHEDRDTDTGMTDHQCQVDLPPPPPPPKPKRKRKMVQANIKLKVPRMKTFRSKSTQTSPCNNANCQCCSNLAFPPPPSVPVPPPSPPPFAYGSAPQPEEPDNTTDEEDEGNEDTDSESDPDWSPSDEEDDLLDDEMEVEEPYIDEDVSPKQQEKFIVFEQNLMELFKTCPKCQSQCAITKVQCRSLGSCLHIKQLCTNRLCLFRRDWESQPRIGTIPAGNILMSAAILFAGSSPTQVLRVLQHMIVKTFSGRTFLNHQSRYLQPAVVQRWKDSQAALIAKLKERGGPLVLGGDGRADSPGHSAKYGVYTLMELDTFQIVDVQVVQSNEVTSSNAMELEGLKRSVAYIHEQGLTIDTIITDRHPSITKWLREEHPDIKHYFDVWHIAKSVKKQLNAASKLKDCELIADWKKAVVSHLYWSATSTPSGDGAVMAAKFRSLANHVKNKHEGHGEHPEVDKCAHEEIEREWFREGSKAYDKLCEIILKPYLKRSLMHMSPLQQTSKVESYHGVMCFWTPKLLVFSFQGMNCRTFLAALHWNENGNRAQALKVDGTGQYKVAFPKPKEGDFVVKKVLTGCTYEYVDQLMVCCVENATNGLKNLRTDMPELRDKPPLCSRYHRIPKEDAIKQHLDQGRFARNAPRDC